MSLTEFNYIIGKSNTIFILLNKNGQLLNTDRKWEEKFGFSNNYAEGKPLTEFVKEKELLKSFFKTFDFSANSSYRFTLTFIKKNTAQINLELTLNPDPEECQFIGLINPVPETYGAEPKQESFEKKLEQKTTELIQTKELLEKERFLLWSGINKMEDPIMFKNTKSEITGCNQAFARLLGREMEEIIGKTDFDLFPKEIATLYQNGDQKTLTSGKSQRQEEWQKNKDGEMVLFDVVKTPLLDNEGNTIGIVGIGRDITKRKTAEKELKSAKEILQNVLNTIPVGVFWKDRNSVYLGGNLTCANYAGLKSPEEIPGKTDYDFPWVKSEAPLYQEGDKWVMENDVAKLNFEEGMTLENGEKLWLRTSKIPLKNEHNEVYGVLGVFEDITSWKITSESLQLSEDKFRMLADNVPGVIYLRKYDKDRTLTYLNSRVEELTGYPKEHFLESKISFSTLYHPEDKEGIVETVEKQLSSTGKFQLEYRLKHKNGHWVWVEEIGASIKKDGKILYLEGFISDISFRKQAERELSKLALIASETNNGIIISDQDEKIEWVNEGFVRLTEYSLKEVIGKKPEEILQGPDSDKKAVEKIKTAIQKQEAVKVELVNYSKSGKKYWFEISIQPIFDQNQNLIQLFAILNDITIRKNQEESIKRHIEGLKKTNQELDNFVYRVSHDLRAPIASSLGLITLARDEKSIDQIQVYLDLQEKSLVRLDEFIRDILNYSRNSRIELHEEEIDFNALIEETFQNFHYLEEAKEIEKILEIQQPDVFYSDKRRLTVILNNLISNAIRFSNHYYKNSWIKVSISTDAQNAKIEISDNGIGIKAEHLSKIFEMFYRATEVKNGSGLGLYIVKESVEKLSGEITVQSDGNNGTKFTITIPNIKTKQM
ncbi:PAS domain-containing sensor histidine kinase [Flexithrix dorotheae]|uniref:PAS domain-containing sensor histidine kinase n=1 Tax=Flexithrix dorotheae TaxID=70993 RepID=UPI00146D63D7|nr:PAS domain-containing sensor histidine kinase [Flexithrix dorotheae]